MVNRIIPIPKLLLKDKKRIVSAKKKTNFSHKSVDCDVTSLVPQAVNTSEDKSRRPANLLFFFTENPFLIDFS